MLKALIYCRVSSERQKKEGNGLESQEKRCRDYSKGKGYKIEKIFLDEGISGGLGLFERPAMKNLIAYLDKHPADDFVIIFDDLSRFARDVKVHIQMKAEFIGRGVKLECLNFNFQDSEESEFAELIMAASNQYQRKSNRRQVCQKMLARLQDGFWCFCTPPGLKNIEHPVYKKILNGLIQPYAGIFKQAIEKYANDDLNTLEEVKEFIDNQYKINKVNKVISLNGVTRILINPLYCGWVSYEKWGVNLQKAKHDGFIEKATFDIVQAKLAGKAKPRLRKDYRLDFPLRGWVVCPICGEPMTASWSRGKLRRHPYYLCKNEKCPMVWKTIKKDRIDRDFELLLDGTKPTNELFDLTKMIFTEVW